MPLNIALLEQFGYTTVEFTISVGIQEIYDGYKEVYFQSQAKGTLWDKTNIEQSVGGEWKTHILQGETSLDNFKDNNGNLNKNIRLGYNGHGAGYNNWRRGETYIIFGVYA